MLWKKKRRLREHEEPERRSRELFGRIAQQVGLANNVVILRVSGVTRYPKSRSECRVDGLPSTQEA